MNQITLDAKKAVVDCIVGKLNNAKTTVVCEYRGLTVNQLEDLRNKLRETNSTFCVYKNSMVVRALKEVGQEQLSDILTGPNAIIFSEDVIAGAKVAAKFAKRNDNLVLKGGLVEGRVVDAKGIKEIASLPGREGLISMLLSCLQAPVRSFACAVKAVADKN